MDTEKSLNFWAEVKYNRLKNQHFIYTNNIIISADEQNPLKYFNNLAEI